MNGQQLSLNGIIMVPSEEYYRLVSENKSLKQEIISLNGEHERFKIVIDQKDRVIDELKKENIELREELNHLKQENKQLRKDVDDLILIKEMSNIVCAIQDLNSDEHLETSFPRHKKLLKNLRRLRISQSHYLITEGIDKDDPDVILYKKIDLLKRLQNIQSSVRNRLNKKVGGDLISIIISFLSNMLPTTQPSISDEDREYIESWWE